MDSKIDLKDEIAVLKAIFGNDIEDEDENGTNDEVKYLRFFIRILPEASRNLSETCACDTFVRLKVVVENETSRPVFKVIECKGMTAKNIAILESQLAKKVPEFSRDEMIFETIVFIKGFLRNNQNQVYKITDVERKQEELEKKKYKDLLEDRCQKIIADKQLRKENLRESLSFEGDDNCDRPKKRCKCSRERLECRFSDFEAEHVLILDCTYHCLQNGFVKYDAIDLTHRKRVTFYRWTFDKIYDMVDFKEQLERIKQDFQVLRKLKCQFLVKYLNFRYDIHANTIIVDVLTELLVDCVFDSYFKKNMLVNHVDLFRTIARDLLTAIDYLHRNNIVHKYINCNSIDMSASGHAKLANYSLHKRLNDLYTNEITNLSKKHDIYEYGVMLYFLVTDIETVEIRYLPESLPFCVKDFISKCLCDEKQRLTANELLNHKLLQVVCESEIDAIRGESESMPVEPRIDSPTTKLIDNSRQMNESRIQKDFDTLTVLGKGGFGEVLKVKNRLDELFYAIKRIKLNPERRDDMKMIRELKLLSRLNHPHVVRYYCSWIEAAAVPGSPRASGANTEPQWSSYNNICSESDESSSDTELYSGDEDVEGEREKDDNGSGEKDSDWIQFVSSVGAEQNKIEPKDLQVRKKDRRRPMVLHSKSEIVYLYIQMEFCEKNTLRTAIDLGLESNSPRVWRLFREILDGLNHIHRNAMIHRDLKPDNVFLTCDDRVKIGDFGLAMTDTFSKATKSPRNAAPATANLSGCVGTVMYMAPELNTKHYQIYNQSVDIYSVGIILFEMTYAFGTAMERYSCLKDIREKSIRFPKDFDCERNKKEYLLIKQMLDHDPLKRPTAKKLLQSQLVPIPEKENREVCEILDYCLSNKSTGAHSYLYLRLFEQTMEPIDDVNFNLMTVSHHQKNLLVLDPLINSLVNIIKNVAVKVFELHGGNEIRTPYLNPVGESFKNRKINVKQLTRTGHIVTLAANLHAPFARYVAEHDLLTARRFTVSEVFHEHLSDIVGHPKEITQAAFDILDVSSTDTLSSDIELIEIVLKIIENLSLAKQFNYKIMLNHCDIIRAFLLFSGVASDRHRDLFRILLKIKDEKLRSPQIKTHFANLNLSKETIEHLLKFLLIETSLEKFVLLMKSFTKRKDEVGRLTRHSLSCFERFCEQLMQNGNIFKQEKVLICPGLIDDFDQYDGLVYQLISLTSDKKQNMVLAFGGNYSRMLSDFKDFFWKTTRMVRDNTRIVQTITGITIYVKNLVNLMRSAKNMQFFDVFICSVRYCGGTTATNPNQLREIIGELKKHSIRYICFDIKSVKDIAMIRNECPVANIVIVTANESKILLQKFNRNQLREFTIETHELIDRLEINRKSVTC